MDNFKITLNDQEFSFKKNEYNFYEVTPFDEAININDLSTALLQQKNHYIEAFGVYNPIPVSVKSKDDDEDEIIPFNIKNKCFFALIKKSCIH